MNAIGPTNEQIADVLERMAGLLVEQQANSYRIGAYLTAAQTVRAHEAPLAELYAEGGADALMALPGIGESLSAHIARYIETVRVGGEAEERAMDPVVLFASVPGISRTLARRIVDELGITTLAELERAAYDGRLGAMKGVGRRTVQALRLQLNSLLQWSALDRARRVRRSARGAARPPDASDFRLAA